MLESLNDEKVIVCRCEDVTLAEVKNAIQQYKIRNIEELKRILRCGMGPCQGRGCERLLRYILKEYAGIETDKLLTVRPPLVPISFGHFKEERHESK